jgi:hypothetical protein
MFEASGGRWQNDRSAQNEDRHAHLQHQALERSAPGAVGDADDDATVLAGSSAAGCSSRSLFGSGGQKSRMAQSMSSRSRTARCTQRRSLQQASAAGTGQRAKRMRFYDPAREFLIRANRAGNAPTTTEHDAIDARAQRTTSAARAATQARYAARV